MMVEDDPDDRGIYGTILCYNGFDVLLVPDGAAALRCAELYRPDLILLDLGLPDADGLDICRALRKRSLAPPAPIIALSGFSQSRMERRAREAGCVCYVEKPTNPVHVLHRIEEILGRPPAPGDGTQPRIIPFV